MILVKTIYPPSLAGVLDPKGVHEREGRGQVWQATPLQGLHVPPHVVTGYMYQGSDSLGTTKPAGSPSIARGSCASTPAQGCCPWPMPSVTPTAPISSSTLIELSC